MFVGRGQQLAQLSSYLQRVHTANDTKPGQAVLIRGRRRVGKSRLVEEFVDQAGVAHLFFAATGRPVEAELQLFATEVAMSNLPGAALFREVTLKSWDAALRLLARALPENAPSIIVFDEMPYLMAADAHFEGTLQRAFDRELSRLPVLMIGIGSDLAMMESLNEYGRPFHQRASEMVVPPLSPLEVAEMLNLAAADAFDAYLVTGGLPLVCSEWNAGTTMWEFLQEAVTNPTSALLVSAERSLAAEFPVEAMAREVLTAVGSGERTFTNIGRASGGIQHASLSRSLNLLLDKRIISADTPLSTKSSRETRYRVSDPYLRFWLAFLGGRIDEIERGRGDRVLDSMRAGWASWRGRAVEPVVREALARIPDDLMPIEGVASGSVGGYWTRNNDPEVDLVIADRSPIAKRVLAVGSIKWLERAPFDMHDFGELIAHRAKVPGADHSTPLLVISRAGVAVDETFSLGPEQLIEAYRL